MENWSVEEFEKQKNWALSQQSKYVEYDNLWGEIYSPRTPTEELMKRLTEHQSKKPRS